MLGTLIAATLLQTSKMEPVMGGMGEVVSGIRAHPEQKLGLYMRRSQINARLDARVRQAANDPWIRVGETRTSVRDVVLEGTPCLLLESTTTREILSHNPMEGELHPRVVRKIARTRQVWVAEDGAILKTQYSQTLPEPFTVDMLFGNGIVVVHKTKDSKKESAQIDLTIDRNQFENEFQTMAWGKQIFQKSKSFALLDPFGSGIRTFEAKMYGTFEALEGQDRVSGYRVEVREGKDKGPTTVWVTNDGRLLQLDLANGERLIVEPKVGEPGLTKVKLGGG
jgi:hypothetical protein